MKISDKSQTPRSQRWGSLGIWYLFVLYFSLIYQLLLTLSGLTSASSLKYVLVYSIPWILLPLFLPRMTKAWFAALGVAFSLTSVIKLSYFLIYHQELSQSVFFTLFDSNSSEAGEYISNYFHWWFVPVILTYLLPPIWLYRHIEVVELPRKATAVVLLLSTFCFAEPFIKYADMDDTNSWELANNKLLNRMAAASPWQFIVSYFRYAEQIDQVKAFAERIEQSNNALDVKLSDNTTKQTYVLVIGESTNRQRMGLYGYQRDTTPNLSNLSEELFVFDNVITSIPYTVEALSQVLTFADQQHPEKTFESANIISLMKYAGFKTYWISNQQTISNRNTILTAFSQLADKQIYLNNNRLQSSSQLDAVVFNAYQSALNDPADKKLIIVHLMGTHIRYDHRYPESYAQFSNQAVTHLALDEDQEKIYNDYDNAILYNDYIVSSLLDTYKTQGAYGAFVYFSDHGEEVFDKRIFYGRDAFNPSSDIYTVPFLIWGNDNWIQNREFPVREVLTQRPYSMDDFIHTWCQLSAIDYQQCDQQKSIVSASFHYPKRLVASSRSPHGLISYEALLSELYGARIADRNNHGDTLD